MKQTARRAALARLLAAALGCASLHALAAEDWPARPVVLVVPFAAGGTTDIVGRAVAQKLGEALRQPVIVDNRPGAGGTLAAGGVAKAPADGHTLFLATIAHSIAPALYRSLSYDFVRDFDPVGLVATTPNVLLVHPSLPVGSVRELIDYVRAHPGKVNYGSAGKGSTEHMSGELFRAMTGTEITHIPYKGGAPMMTDLVAGQIQMAIETSPSAYPHVRSGRVKALAVTSAARSPIYPGVPTLDEAGVKGFDVTTWFALMAPRGTPPAVLQRLAGELAKVLAQPDLRARFEELGLAPGDLSGEPLRAFVRAETAKWGKVAKDAGVSAE